LFRCLVRCSWYPKITAIFGYTRISTAGQSDGLQRNALIEVAVPAEHIWAHAVAGSSNADDRPAWVKLSEYARDGDTVVVWRIDRLGRSRRSQPVSASLAALSR
jgi:DNA invertase Pin-like site-specific DNA recombinase